MATLLQIFIEEAVEYGMGNHLPVIKEAGQTESFLFFSWWGIWIFHVALPLGKVAVASFLLALLADTRAEPSWLRIRDSLLTLGRSKETILSALHSLHKRHLLHPKPIHHSLRVPDAKSSVGAGSTDQMQHHRKSRLWVLSRG